MENLKWMYEAVQKFGDDSSVFHGFILLDEMSIQEDLSIIKCGEYWELMGGIDLGPLVNDLEKIGGQNTGFKLATHCFQYIYQSFLGFKWPVAYYGSHNVNGHAIYLTFWPLADVLSTFRFEVHAALMDGSNNNCQFTRLMMNYSNARIHEYITLNLFDDTVQVAMTQDCKHTFKKI